jgi:membrane fusion protein, adhesin transport system
MLNISDNNISDLIEFDKFKSCKMIKRGKSTRLFLWLIVGLSCLLFILLFFPWTQNISTKGYVTTRFPAQRPQSIQSVIPGRIEEWFVKEGDFVKKGAKIAALSEVKSAYFDDKLIERTVVQLDAKKASTTSYDGKVTALEQQYKALLASKTLKQAEVKNKILQSYNKIATDSINLIASTNTLQISENQLERIQTLYDKGLKSLSDLQEKSYKVQLARAKVTAQENKLLNQRNNLINLRLQIQQTERDYANKLAKSLSDKQSALSAQLETVAEVAKLENKVSNYEARQTYQMITAPQDGYITKTAKKGLGEILKEGATVATIMPAKPELAVELYIRPQDLPLLEREGLDSSDSKDKILLRFDGWPAIVISGWPESSTGVFTGEVAAMDQVINDEGYYRVLVSPLVLDKAWPDKLRVGTGVSAFILLNEVPIWYEVWRQLNGFPADFYRKKNSKKVNLKRKAPIKSVK